MGNPYDGSNELYGWMDSSGKIYPVKDCEHCRWAREEFKEKAPLTEPDLYYDAMYARNWLLLTAMGLNTLYLEGNQLNEFQKGATIDLAIKHEKGYVEFCNIKSGLTRIIWNA